MNSKGFLPFYWLPLPVFTSPFPVRRFPASRFVRAHVLLATSSGLHIAFSGQQLFSLTRFVRSQLSAVGFISCATGALLKDPFPFPAEWTIFSLFSSGTFRASGLCWGCWSTHWVSCRVLTSSSRNQFHLGSASFFYMLRFSFPSTSYWRCVLFSNVYFWHLCGQNQAPQLCGLTSGYSILLIYASVSVPIACYFFYYYSSIV